MPGADLRLVLWEVAARFRFGEQEILAMPLSRLLFWHEGHGRIKDGDREEIAAMMGGK